MKSQKPHHNGLELGDLEFEEIIMNTLTDSEWADLCGLCNALQHRSQRDTGDRVPIPDRKLSGWEGEPGQRVFVVRNADGELDRFEETTLQRFWSTAGKIPTIEEMRAYAEGELAAANHESHFPLALFVLAREARRYHRYLETMHAAPESVGCARSMADMLEALSLAELIAGVHGEDREGLWTDRVCPPITEDMFQGMRAAVEALDLPGLIAPVRQLPQELRDEVETMADLACNEASTAMGES
jgi:hypothetical protein